MICHPYRCVFIHIPKTGGISVDHVFLELVGLTWDTRAPLLLRANDDPAKGPPRLAHLKATEYVSCGHLSPDQFDAYFKFSFVRNPWDRIVSEYKYRGHPMRMSFKTWLFEFLPEPGFTDAYRHIVPQHEFIHDAEGTLLADFVGRYENLQADFDVICERLGIPRTPLPTRTARWSRHVSSRSMTSRSGSSAGSGRSTPGTSTPTTPITTTTNRARTWPSATARTWNCSAMPSGHPRRLRRRLPASAGDRTPASASI